MRYGHSLGGWRCRLNLSMFLLTIAVGRIWSVQSVLEFNAIKKNLRIMSDIERGFWTVLFRMASRVFLFFTPSDSSLVRSQRLYAGRWRCTPLKTQSTPYRKVINDAGVPLLESWPVLFRHMTLEFESCVLLALYWGKLFTFSPRCLWVKVD